MSSASSAIKLGLLAFAACLYATGSQAQQAVGDTGHNAVPLAGRADGGVIDRVEVALARSSGDAKRDAAELKRLKADVAELEGQDFNQLQVDASLKDARARFGAGHVAYRVLGAETPGRVVLLVELDPATGEPAPELKQAAGPAQFPTLYQSDRALVKALISGGVGLYSDGNPWFGQPALFLKNSPVAGHLPGARASWTEGYVEYGLGAASQIGDSPLYAYAAATVLTSWSLGQDIYRDNPRLYTAAEKAYGGLLYVNPGNRASANLTLGRQNVTLNDGFLINFVKGSANVNQRGGTYIGPRNASDFSAVFEGKAGDWSTKLFYIDPNELESLESNTTFAGANLRYAFTPTLSFDASLIDIPQSDATLAAPGGVRLSRAGVATRAGHGLWKKALGVDGLWFESEGAYQTSQRFDMFAYAWYGLAGYRFTEAAWTPSISYRYAYFSGDDPTTKRYERFDPLMSTGLGVWLQGVSFGKVTTNSNLATHRIQINVTPNPSLNVTFDWHKLMAPQLNNLGGNPALSVLTSHNLGQEFTLTGRWAINQNLYLQSLGSIAVPGKALRDVGATAPWTTLQASLYWTL